MCASHIPMAAETTTERAVNATILSPITNFFRTVFGCRCFSPGRTIPRPVM